MQTNLLFDSDVHRRLPKCVLSDNFLFVSNSTLSLELQCLIFLPLLLNLGRFILQDILHNFDGLVGGQWLSILLVDKLIRVKVLLNLLLNLIHQECSLSRCHGFSPQFVVLFLKIYFLVSVNGLKSTKPTL